jgi:hypothetical protein
MVRTLAEKIHDNRFLRLIANMLKAGYLEDWQYHETLSGCPQGGVVSPIFSNVYLDKLDQFVERVHRGAAAADRDQPPAPTAARVGVIVRLGGEPACAGSFGIDRCQVIECRSYGSRLTFRSTTSSPAVRAVGTSALYRTVSSAATRQTPSGPGS